MQAVQRIDEDAHGDTARRRGGQRRLDGASDVVIERHVDLKVHALPAAIDRRQEPSACRRVVQLDFDSVAVDRLGARRGIQSLRQ